MPGAPSALGDAATGAFLAAAAARSAYWAMRADLDPTSPDAEPILSSGLELVEQGRSGGVAGAADPQRADPLTIRVS